MLWRLLELDDDPVGAARIDGSSAFARPGRNNLRTAESPKSGRLDIINDLFDVFDLECDMGKARVARTQIHRALRNWMDVVEKLDAIPRAKRENDVDFGARNAGNVLNRRTGLTGFRRDRKTKNVTEECRRLYRDRRR